MIRIENLLKNNIIFHKYQGVRLYTYYTSFTPYNPDKKCDRGTRSPHSQSLKQNKYEAESILFITC